MKRYDATVLAMQQVETFISAAALPVQVTIDLGRIEIIDADGGTARLLEMLCQGTVGIDGYTSARVDGVEVKARGR